MREVDEGQSRCTILRELSEATSTGPGLRAHAAVDVHEPCTWTLMKKEITKVNPSAGITFLEIGGDPADRTQRITTDTSARPSPPSTRT